VRSFSWIGVVAVATSSLPAQKPESGQLELGVGFTMQVPPDVNLRPLCTEMSLPCTSPKTFPDMGLAVTAGRYWKWFGLTTEAGFWGNHWAAGISADSQRTNWVQYALAGPAIRSPVITFGSSDPHHFQLHAQALAGGLASTLGGTAPIKQVGVGISGWVKTNLWVRLQTDRSFTDDEPRALSGARWLIAVVFTPLGGEPETKPGSREVGRRARPGDAP
jgi:hypothetical protein